MKSKSSRSVVAALFLLCVISLAACGDGAKKLTSITVTPATASIDALDNGTGNTQQFTAMGTFGSSPAVDITSQVTWASSNSAVAGINTSGLATAATPPDTATTTITASLSGKTGTATLTVVHPIQSISVGPLAVTKTAGLTQQYTATGTYKNVAGTTHTEAVTSVATWNSATPATATIDNNGLATSFAPGTSNITAKIGAVTSTPVAVFTVTAAVPTALKVSPASPSIAIGTSTNLTALELKTDGSTQALTGTVTWATSACTPAGAVLIAASGVNGNEAVNGQKAGSCTVTATEGALTGNTTVAVVTGTTHFAFVANTADATPDIGGYAVNASAATPLTPLSPATTAVTTDTQQAVLNPNGRYLYSIDSAGDVHVYTVSSAGALALPTEPSPLPNVSSGVNTFNYGIVDPTGRFFLAIDFDGNALHSAAIDPAAGTLGTVSAVTGLNGPEFVAIDRQGKYAYVVSDDDKIHAFAINQTNGTLTALSTPTYSTGSFPFAVTVDPSNKFVYTANSGDNTVSVFTLDSATGLLTKVGADFVLTGSPVFVTNVIVDPSSKYLFVLDSGDGTNPGGVYGFNINATTGAVGTALTGSPVATGLDPFGLAIDATGTLIATENNSSNTISLIKVGTGGAMSAETPATVATGAQPLWVTFLNAP